MAMTIKEQMDRLLAADAGRDPGGMVACHAVVLQEEAVARALQLAARMVRSDGRLNRRARELAEQHLRRAAATWREAPPVKVIVYDEEDEEAGSVARR